MNTAGNPASSNAITRNFLDSILIEMRHIDNTLPDTTFRLFGEEFATPVTTAALSHLGKDSENGMVEFARGGAMANAIVFTGMGNTKELQEMVATGAKVIKIIKPYEDEKLICEKIRHTEDCGAFALGMDIDHAFNKKGEYDNVLGFPMRPKTLDDLKRYANMTSLPFIVKGVLSRTDAEKCAEIGADGIVLSHHNGIIDYAAPPLMVLPEIMETVKGKLAVFVDCCMESGADAFKALSLGATAVSVGRKLMKPLSEQGAEGVAETIKLMTTQLKGIMARTGVANLSNFDPSVLRMP